MKTPLPRRLLPLLALLAATAGCSAVRNKYVRPDYEQADKTRVKRLAVVTQPLPGGDAKAGELWSLVARKYVNQNRNFIAKVNEARDGEATPDALRALCQEGIEGVLHLDPTGTRRTGKGVEAQVEARLVRCSDGEDVWRAEAGGSWSSDDEGLKEITQQYASEVGEEVTPWVAPTFRLLQATLDTLPQPELTEQDKDEKIELGE